jgi:hypothetical protein
MSQALCVAWIELTNQIVRREIGGKNRVVAAVLVTDQRHVHSEIVVFVSTEASLHLWHQLVDENIYQRREGGRQRKEYITTESVLRGYNWVPCIHSFTI